MSTEIFSLETGESKSTSQSTSWSTLALPSVLSMKKRTKKWKTSTIQKKDKSANGVNGPILKMKRPASIGKNLKVSKNGKVTSGKEPIQVGTIKKTTTSGPTTITGGTGEAGEVGLEAGGENDIFTNFQFTYFLLNPLFLLFSLPIFFYLIHKLILFSIYSNKKY